MTPGAWRAALLYTALTIGLAYPLSIHPAGSVLSPSPDTNLFLWTLQWDVHALTHQPWAIFDANIYFPEARTLAYSENLIGSAPFAAPVLWLTGNAVLAMNLIVLAACVLCGLGTYLLALRLGISPRGATLAGLIFAFAPPRFLRLDQVHLATIEWIPFCLASLHAYWTDGNKWHARLAAGFFTLQALSTGHGAVFLMLAIGVLVCVRIASGEFRISTRWVREFGAIGVVLLMPTALVLWPYRVVQQEMGLRRSLENWAVPWTSFLASGTHVHSFLNSLLPSWHINDTIGPQLFPGWIPLGLAAIAIHWMPVRAARIAVPLRMWACLAAVLDAAIIAGVVVGAFSAAGVSRFRIGDVVILTIRQAWRPWVAALVATAGRVALARRFPFEPATRVARWLRTAQEWIRTNQRHSALSYAILTILSLWLAAGPPISLWPLVYWLPGLNFIRAPSRFVLVAVLGLAVLAGIGFDRLAARLSPKARAFAAFAVGVLLVVEFAAGPLEITPYDVTPPPIDQWLASQPTPFVIAEVPLGDPASLGEWERRESGYMLHASAHWQKTVHGYSGFRSPLHEVLYTRMTTFPDDESVRRLMDLGVTRVVVHTDLYQPGEWDRAAARMAAFTNVLRLEHVEGEGRVYSLTR